MRGRRRRFISPRRGETQNQNPGCGCLLTLWLALVVLNAVAAALRSFFEWMAQINWSTVLIASLGIVCLSGLLFLAYLPLGDWLEQRRRRKRWRREHPQVEALGRSVMTASGIPDEGHAASNGQPICPYCQSPLGEGEPRFLCPACGIPHHVDCWRENGGCTTYGCRQAPQR